MSVTVVVALAWGGTLVGTAGAATSAAKADPPGGLAASGEPARELTVPSGDMTDLPPTPSSKPAKHSGFDKTRSQRVDELTTDRSEVFANPDGSRTMDASSVPVRFRDKQGAWNDFDFGLVEAPAPPPTAAVGKLPGSGTALVARSSDRGVAIPTDPSAGVATWDSPVGRFTVGVPDVAKDAKAARVVDSSKARFDAASPDGPSVVMSLRVSGFEQDVVVPTSAGPSSYRTRWELPEGVSVRPVGEDGVEFVAKDGSVVAWFGGGLAHDASGDHPSKWAEKIATTRIVDAGAGYAVIEVAVAPEWLTDPARVFPVVIDPTLEIASGGTGGWDTYTDYVNPTFSGYSQDQLRVGQWTDTFYESYLMFDFANNGGPTPGASTTITESHLTVYNTASNGGGPMQIYALGSGMGWFTTWNTPPVTDGEGVRSAWTWTGGPPYGGAGFVSFDTAEIAKSWFHDSKPNYGIKLTADPGAATNGRYFWSGDSGLTAPRFSVTWFQGPAEAQPNTPADKTIVASATPTLTANAVADPTVLYSFRVSTGAGSQLGSVVDQSGWQSSPTYVVKAGALLDGGTYHWETWTRDAANTAWTAPAWKREFTVDLRRGTSGPSPTDGVGPVGVNLATGNVSATVKTPSFPAVGGSAGLTLAYNSQETRPNGLVGAFYPNTSMSGNPEAIRYDTTVSYDWGLNAPTDPLGWDGWSARWTGYVTVPTTGSYTFGANSDDGVRVKIGTDTVVDRWFDQAMGGPSYGTAKTLTAGQAYPITVEYYENQGGSGLQLWVQGPPGTFQVPSTWLTRDAPALPTGWRLSAAQSPRYTQVVAYGSSIVAYSATGAPTTFPGRPEGGYDSPTGGYGIAAHEGAGWTITADDGQLYHFDNSGNLTRVDSVLDDQSSAALQYTWTGTNPRLTTMTDPVSGRTITLTYGGGSCGTQPSGFDAVPSGMLCKIDWWDGTSSFYRYKTGQLSRIEDLGTVVTDLGYDTAGRLNQVRDPLAYDTITAGVRADDATARTVIAYDTNGRATDVTLPAPTAAAARPKHTYTYTWNADGSGTTDVTVSGLSPAPANGWAQRVTYDAAKRQIASTDAGGLTSTIEWDAVKDRRTRTTDPAGMMSTVEYDDADRATGGWGPAPAGWFGTGIVPVGHETDTPHSTTAYDEGVTGLAVAYWNNTSLSGQPVAHGTGIGGSGGAVDRDWGTSAPTSGVNADGWSARLTGDIIIPHAGLATFWIAGDDGVRLFIDDHEVIDSWHDCNCWRMGDFNNTAGANSRHQIRIDYYENSGGSQLRLYWAWPGQALSLFPGANLQSRYDLSTTSTGADGNQARTVYANPENGLATSTIADPGGLALATNLGYETSGLRRLTSRTLPAGNAYTYGYYGNAETRDNPCTGAADPANQAGALKTRTSPDPDGAGPQTARVDEKVYDAAGRVVATRINSGSWTCATYDNRGRVTEAVVPAFGGEAARTVTNTYAVGGNPLVNKVSDPAGDIATTSDLLGRGVSSTDVWGKVTTSTYDQAGRVTDSTGPGIGGTATLHTDYDSAGRIAAVKLDGQTLAVPAYDAAGRVDSVAYPSGAGNAGNGTSLAPVARDSLGRTTGLTWKDPSAAVITSDETTLSLSGRVVDQSIDGTDADPANDNFEYDGAGRLTTARVPRHTYAYSFAGTGGCGTLATAGKNTNRTAMTDNAGTPVTYCYDNADRITATTTAGMGTIAYDAHNNMTTLGTETLVYDGADRHMASTANGTTVRYTRDASGAIVARTVSSVPTYRDAASNKTVTGANSLVVNRPTGTQPGDVLVAQVTVFNSTPNAPTGWTLVDTATQTYVTTRVWTRVAAAGDPTSWTFTWTGSKRAAGGIAAYSGVDTTNPVMTSATHLHNGAEVSSHTAAAVTTTDANAMLVTAYGLRDGSALTPPSGMTERWDLNNGTTNAIAAGYDDQLLGAAGNTGTRTSSSAATSQSSNITVALRATSTTRRYSAGVTLDTANNVTEQFIGLPGGAALTRRAGSQVWSYPNLHGDISATADATGTKQGTTLAYDPYGNALTGVPDNRADDLDHAWLGQHQIPSEHEAGLLALIEMGARVYNPALGRFLQDDPIDAGGCNTQDYVCADPVNTKDLTGKSEFDYDWVIWMIATYGFATQEDKYQFMVSDPQAFADALAFIDLGLVGDPALTFGESAQVFFYESHPTVAPEPTFDGWNTFGGWTGGPIGGFVEKFAQPGARFVGGCVGGGTLGWAVGWSYGMGSGTPEVWAPAGAVLGCVAGGVINVHNENPWYSPLQRPGG